MNSVTELEEERETKWEGEVSADLNGAKSDEIWKLIADFCNLHKWFPIDTCYKVEGISGEPGLTRYCAATGDGACGGASGTKWAKERLVLMDPMKQVLRYEVLENNVGFKSYVATIKVLPIDGGDGSSGCKIVWSFVTDPVGGWRFEELMGYVQFCVGFMAEKMIGFVQKNG